MSAAGIRRVDIAIRYGDGPYPGLFALPLVEEVFGAYAAPGVSDENTCLSEVTLLETKWQQSILQDVNWPVWLAQAQLDAGNVERIVRFDEEHFVLQAAIAGRGIALASSALVADMVARKLLVAVRPELQLKGSSYTALCLEEHAQIRKVSAFLDWLGARFD